MKLEHSCHLCKKSGEINHERCSEYWEIKENKAKYNESQRDRNRFAGYRQGDR